MACIGRLSFGIYLCHILVMRYFLWNLAFVRDIDNYVLQTVVVIIMTFMISIIICFGISYLPKAKYIIGYGNQISRR